MPQFPQLQHEEKPISHPLGYRSACTRPSGHMASTVSRCLGSSAGFHLVLSVSSCPSLSTPCVTARASQHEPDHTAPCLKPCTGFHFLLESSPYPLLGPRSPVSPHGLRPSDCVCCRARLAHDPPSKLSTLPVFPTHTSAPALGACPSLCLDVHLRSSWGRLLAVPRTLRRCPMPRGTCLDSPNLSPSPAPSPYICCVLLGSTPLPFLQPPELESHATNGITY